MTEGRYICIHCGTFLPALYEQYGGGHIRLSQCRHCNRVADKYIEYDNVLLFIDLILIKPSAYRHTIYNVLLAEPFHNNEIMQNTSSTRGNGGSKAPQLASVSATMDNLMSSTSDSPNFSFRSTTSLIPLVFRLGILMLLFEVYVTWAYQEKSFIEKSEHTSLIISLVLKGPIQYLYFLSTTLLQNIILCISLSYYGLHWLPFPSTKTTHLENPSLSGMASFSPSPTLPTLSHFGISSTKSNNSEYMDTRSSISVSSSPSPSLFGSLSKHKNDSDNNIPPMTTKITDILSYKPTFQRIFQLMVTTVLISNIIKLFPIVMLIWPYDSPILHATRLLVRIVHLFLLIEAVYIVFIDPKNNKKKSSVNSNKGSADYYKVVAVVLASELTRIVVSHLIVVFIASAIWGVSVREIGLDDWKMLKVGIRMLEELGEYILGEV